MCNQNPSPFENAHMEAIQRMEELLKQDLSNFGSNLFEAINAAVAKNFPDLLDGGDSGERAKIEQRIGELVANRLTNRLPNNVTFDKSNFQFIFNRT